MSDEQETLWQAFLRWLLPARQMFGSELRAIERIAECRREPDPDIWADPRIQRRIIEGRGLKTGKLYGYLGQPADRGHVTDFRRPANMTREIAR